MEKVLTLNEVAEMIRVPRATLRYWRHQGTGPLSFKMGPRRVMYKERDVLDWIDTQYARKRRARCLSRSASSIYRHDVWTGRAAWTKKAM